MHFDIKTKKWKIMLYVLLTLVNFFVIWLLVGDLNLLSQSWLIPKDGILWHGTVTNNNIDWLVLVFGRFGQTRQELEEHLNKTVDIINNQIGTYIFDVQILIPVLISVGVWLIVPWIGRLIRFNNYDLVPFTYSVIFFSLSWIFSGLIPYWANAHLWWLLLRLFISFIIAIISWYLINLFIKFLFSKSGYQTSYINELVSIKKQDDLAKQNAKKFVDEYHQRKSLEKDYIEVDK